MAVMETTTVKPVVTHETFRSEEPAFLKMAIGRRDAVRKEAAKRTLRSVIRIYEGSFTLDETMTRLSTQKFVLQSLVTQGEEIGLGTNSLSSVRC
jgi:hypothetical protein